jgi:hypothetical protein
MPIALLFLCLSWPARAAVPTNSISVLTAITTPSSNTFLEVADMSATPKSRKIWLLDLANAIFSYGSSSTNPASIIYVTNIVVQTNSVTVLKGVHITISNSITILTNGTFTLQNLPLPAVLVVGTNGIVTNATLSGLTLGNDNTLTATGVTTGVTPLAYSGTNITGFNCLTNNATYTLTLTNHCLFGASTFTGLPNTTTNVFFTLGLKQDSAGGYVPKFTNSIVAWADGNQPVIKTNANAVSYLYFHSHLFTNGMLVGSPNINVQ